MLKNPLQSIFSRHTWQHCWNGLSRTFSSQTRRRQSLSTEVLAVESRTLLSSVLVSGVTISDAISAPGEQDVFTFQAVKGNAVTLNLGRTTTGYFPVVDIFSPTGALVYDGPSTGVAAFDVQLNSIAENGIYTVIVRSSLGTTGGSYNMTYVKLAGPQILQVGEGALTSGITRSGIITPADIDLYTFDAVPGNAVTLNLARTTTNYSPEVDVYAPNGVLVYDGPIGGSISYDLLLNNFTQSGTYTVLVKAADGGGAGSYNLTYVKLAGTHTLPVDEGVLTSGVTKFGTITEADIDVYTFQATAGNAVTFNLARTTTSFVPEVDIFAPNGLLIYDGVPNGPGAFDVFLNTFTQTGTYTVIVKASNGGSVGDYSMTYVKVAAPHTLPAGEGVLTSGVTVISSITPGDIDVYTFVGIVGDAVTLNLARTTDFYTPEVDIFAPDGQLVYDGLTGGSVSHDVLLNTFTQNGTYTVVVKSSDGGSPGGYNMTYAKLPGTHTLPVGEGALTSGLTKSGSLNLSDIDLYTFQAGPGSVVTLNVARSALYFSPEVDIFAPNGVLVYDGPAAGVVEYDLVLNSFTQTGTYTVLIKDGKGGGVGDYNLTYVQVGAAHTLPVDEGVLTSGVTKSGAITPADIDVYTFQATAGRAVTLNLASTMLNYTLEVDIFAPDGRLVYDGLTTGSPAYDLFLNSFTQTGIYTVLVKSSNGGAIGTYNMTYVSLPGAQTLQVGEGSLTYGDTKAGSIGAADIDLYTFQAGPGSSIQLDLARTTTTFFPEVDIFAPNGTLIYDGPANGAATYNLVLRTFPVSGTYTVLVKASTGASVGDYYVRYMFPPVVSSAPLLASLPQSQSLLSSRLREIV